MWGTESAFYLSFKVDGTTKYVLHTIMAIPMAHRGQQPAFHLNTYVSLELAQKQPESFEVVDQILILHMCMMI
jgi:hypothetical protein